MIGIIKVYGGMLLAGLGQTLLLTLLALIIAMVNWYDFWPDECWT